MASIEAGELALRQARHAFWNHEAISIEQIGACLDSVDLAIAERARTSRPWSTYATVSVGLLVAWALLTLLTVYTQSESVRSTFPVFLLSFAVLLVNSLVAGFGYLLHPPPTMLVGRLLDDVSLCQRMIVHACGEDRATLLADIRQLRYPNLYPLLLRKSAETAELAGLDELISELSTACEAGTDSVRLPFRYRTLSVDDRQIQSRGTSYPVSEVSHVSIAPVHRRKRAFVVLSIVLAAVAATALLLGHPPEWASSPLKLRAAVMRVPGVFLVFLFWYLNWSSRRRLVRIDLNSGDRLSIGVSSPGEASAVERAIRSALASAVRTPPVDE